MFTGTQLLPGNQVLIASTDGIIQSLVHADDAGDDVQQVEGILSPGFINCHCHLELSHMQGIIPEKTGLIDFVFKIVTQRHTDENKIASAIETAESDMINNGIVAVGDIVNNPTTLKQKHKNRITYYNFIEASGWLPSIAESRLQRSVELLHLFQADHTTSIVPHAPYSVSQNLWQTISPYFNSKTITIHNQETAFEDDLFLNNTGNFVEMYRMMNIDHSFYKPTGKSSLQSYYPSLHNAAKILLVHNTFTKPNDIQFATAEAVKNSQQLFWCLCINANLYIEDALPPIDQLMANNCSIVLGTDSLASNHALSIWNEIKTIQRNYPTIALEIMLTWATHNGAQALNIADKFGSFDAGMQPGIIAINPEKNTVSRLL